MAHLPDGILSAPVLVTGAVVTAGALAFALRRLDYERIPQAALLTSAFFVASLVSIPVGASSVHPILGGLMGLILGWAVVPALVVGLTLQAAFFGYGGILVLGVNAMNIALPALACAALLGGLSRRAEGRWLFLTGAAAGALGVALTGIMVSASLALSDPAYAAASKVIVATYLPLAVVEAALTGGSIVFIRRVAPEAMLPAEALDG